MGRGCGQRGLLQRGSPESGQSVGNAFWAGMRQELHRASCEEAIENKMLQG